MIVGKRIIAAAGALTIRAAGDWAASQVHVTQVPSSWQAGPEARQMIDAEWAAAATRPGVVLFDGPTCRLEGFDVDPSGLTLRLSQTSYKIFLGTNLTHPELADVHSPAVLANSLGVGVPVRTADGFIIMGRRNQSVVCYPGRTHPFAGALEPRDGHPFISARRELREEAQLEEHDLISIRCIGIAEDHAIRQPELVLRADVRTLRRQIESNVARDEHHDIHAIGATRQAVASAVDDAALTPVGVGALLLWGRSEWGEDWLDQTVRGHCD